MMLRAKAERKAEREANGEPEPENFEPAWDIERNEDRVVELESEMGTRNALPALEDVDMAAEREKAARKKEWRERLEKQKAERMAAQKETKRV